MWSCGRIFSRVLGFCLLALGPLLVAECTPGQWVGDLFMVRVQLGIAPGDWVFLDEHNKVHRVIPNIKKTVGFPDLCRTCGGVSYLSHWHGDALYTLADGEKVIEGGMAFRNHVFAKWQEGEWMFLGSHKGPDENLLHIVPCDGGRFIVISSRTDLFDDKRADRSPFCRMSAQEGRDVLRIDASIDHGQDALRGRMSDPGCFGLAWHGQVIMTEGRATVLNDETGLYWVFSTETARLVKAGGIFRNVTPEMIAKGGFERAVLCAHPERSGTVLVSAQDEGPLLAEKEDATKEYHDLWYSFPDGDGIRPEDEINVLYYRRLEEIMARSPLIVWYRIHPENGRVERLPAPPEGGASFREGWTNEFWRPMPDGSVKMDWNPHIDKIKARASEWADGSRGGAAPKEAEGAGPSLADEDKAKGDAPPEGNVADGGADKDKAADKAGASLRG